MRLCSGSTKLAALLISLPSASHILLAGRCIISNLYLSGGAPPISALAGHARNFGRKIFLGLLDAFADRESLKTRDL